MAVRRHEQGDVAGKIASINGAAYIFAPAIGVALFSVWEPATFLIIGAALLFLILWGRRALISPGLTRLSLQRKKKGRPKSTLKKSLGEDAYKAISV